jgi:hypothetical protein
VGTVAAMLAVWKAGGMCVPMRDAGAFSPPANSADRPLIAMCESDQVEDVRRLTPMVRDIVAFDTRPGTASPELPRVTGTDLAYIRPHQPVGGVLVDHRALIAQALAAGETDPPEVIADNHDPYGTFVIQACRALIRRRTLVLGTPESVGGPQRPAEPVAFAENGWPEAAYALVTGAADGRPVSRRAARGARLLVLDDDMRLLPPGAAGHLYAGGAMLARGYAHRPALTAERFIPNPHQTVEERADTRFGPAGRNALLFRTGMLARLRADGTIEPVDERVPGPGSRLLRRKPHRRG